MDRRAEIRALLNMSVAEIQRQAGRRLWVGADVSAVYARMANDIHAEIAAARERGESLRLILPVGPTGQYPLLAERLRAARLPLDHCWFFFMDEYADECGRALPIEHPLSFRRQMESLFFAGLSPMNALNRERVYFPTGDNRAEMAAALVADGGVDTCYGGIGIHGHVAFNEPGPGVAAARLRLVALREHTVTLAALRAGVGGNLLAFPKWAHTLGLSEIRAARRIRLYARSLPPWDWAKTALRLALFGRPDDDYPVTLLPHERTKIHTDLASLTPPSLII